MNKWILILCLPLFGFTMIKDKHTDFQSVDDELNNIEDNKQDIQFKTFPGTPTLTDLQDHEFVLVVTTGIARIMFRDNIEIYSVNMSCVTVIR